MDEGQRYFVTHQILSGIKFITINNERYKVIAPSRELKLLAEHVYQDTIEALRFDNFITREKATRLLIGLGMWGPAEDEGLKKLEKHLEDQKVRLYHAMYDREKQTRTRKTIKIIKKNIHKSYVKKYALDHMTLEYHALVTKRKFLIGRCLRDMNNDVVYEEDGFWNANSTILERVVEALDRDMLSVEDFRELARHDPWRSVWNIGKDGCMGIAAADLTEDQKTLTTFAKMYDNAYQSVDCPSDEIFEDDDMFDGWMIDQRRTREKEQKQKETETLNNIPDKAQEVFLSAPTREDADKIYDLNTTTSRHVIKERAAMIEAHGTIEAQHLPDTQRELFQQNRQEYLSKMKGR